MTISTQTTSTTSQHSNTIGTGKTHAALLKNYQNRPCHPLLKKQKSIKQKSVTSSSSTKKTVDLKKFRERDLFKWAEEYSRLGVNRRKFEKSWSKKSTGFYEKNRIFVISEFRRNKKIRTLNLILQVFWV